MYAMAEESDLVSVFELYDMNKLGNLYNVGIWNPI